MVELKPSTHSFRDEAARKLQNLSIFYLLFSLKASYFTKLGPLLFFILNQINLYEELESNMHVHTPFVLYML